MWKWTVSSVSNKLGWCLLKIRSQILHTISELKILCELMSLDLTHTHTHTQVNGGENFGHPRRSGEKGIKGTCHLQIFSVRPDSYFSHLVRGIPPPLKNIYIYTYIYVFVNWDDYSQLFLEKWASHVPVATNQWYSVNAERIIPDKNAGWCVSLQLETLG